MRVAALLLVFAAAASAAPVAGRVSTPTGVAPALVLYAWSLNGEQLYSTTVADGRTSFALDLPRGRYWMFATPAAPGAPPVYAAYTGSAACGRGAERAGRDCADHELKVVMVGAHGQSGIELSDWHLDDRVTRDLDRILGRADAEGDAELAAPKFSEYPAQPYTGPRAPALAVDADGRVERDREPLAVALGGSPNFAGRIVLVRLSCGAGCEHAVLVDVASGAVAYPPALAALPAPVSCASRDALLYRRDSRLITVTGRDGEELVTRYFVWEAGGGPLKPVAALAGASEERCPARD